MNLKYAAVAGAATMLMAGAAFAQAGQPSPADSTGTGSPTTGAAMNPSTSNSTTATTDATGQVNPSPNASVSGSASTTGATTPSTTTDTTTGVTTSSTTNSADVNGQNASVTTQTVAMAPIPDTAANRAKYGQPLSRAGRHSKPAGN